MHWDVYEVSLELIRRLAAVAAAVGRHDAALAGQMRRAASSVPLNLREGRRRAGRDRSHLWRVAAGSADEVLAALQVAEAWGYLDGGVVAEPVALCDRLLAMLYRLTH